MHFTIFSKEEEEEEEEEDAQIGLRNADILCFL
jgi:hypothetical protein